MLQNTVIQKLYCKLWTLMFLVLVIAQMSHFRLAELWLEFGVGKHYRIISAHNIASVMSYEKASTLQFFHALTGCDTTSALEKSAWTIWNVFPEITPIFSTLSNTFCVLTDKMLEKIEQYVVLLNSKTSEAKRINEA